MMRVFPAAAVLLLMLTGGVVAGPTTSPMVGKWMAVSYMGEAIPEGAMWVENRDDGTGTLHEGDEDFPYTWTHDQEAGTCTIVSEGEEAVFNVTFGDDGTCTFTNPDDPEDVTVLKRMAD